MEKMLMEEKHINQEPTVTVDGKTVPLSHSETGKLGITKGEFKNLITKILRESPSGSLSQRTLMGSLLSRLGIRTHGKPREEYVKDYLRCLSELKEANIIRYVSAKTRLHVRLS